QRQCTLAALATGRLPRRLRRCGRTHLALRHRRADHAVRLLLHHIELRAGARRFILLLDQQPGWLPLVPARAHAYQREAAAELLRLQPALELALAQAPTRIANRPPGAAFPDDHRARAVVTLGDNAFEA